MNYIYIYIYLAEKVSKIPSNKKNVLATCNDSILRNFKHIQYKEDIAYCTLEQSDQRIMYHVIDCAKDNFQNILVLTSNIDV